MKLEGYIAKEIKIGTYEPDNNSGKRVLLIIETESDFPTIAPLTEADIDELIAEIKSRRQQLWLRPIFRWLRERWQARKNEQHLPKSARSFHEQTQRKRNSARKRKAL